MPSDEIAGSGVLKSYRATPFCVREVIHDGSLGSLAPPLHTVVMNHTAKRGVMRIDGGPPIAQVLAREAVVFMPKGLLVSYETRRGRHPSTKIELSDETVDGATREHVDFSLISFRLADLTSPVTVSLFHALRQFAAVDDGSSWPLMLESAAVSMAVAVVRGLSPEASTVMARLPNGLSAARRRRVMEYIDANIRRPITVAELADKASMSRYHFMRSFKKTVGETPMRYICRRRIEVAKKMLATRSDPIAEIALEAGYSSQSHMTTVFKAMVGVTPGEFRRRVLAWLCVSVAPWLDPVATLLKEV